MKKNLFLLVGLFWGVSATAQRWVELGTGKNALNANSEITKVCSDDSGNIYATGYFTNSKGKCYVAKWNGISWSELGSGKNALNPNGAIFSLKFDNLGNLYCYGTFTDSKGYCYVAKWNGSSWSELGTGSNALKANNQIDNVIIDSLGNLYCAGNFTNSNGYNYVAMWNGKTWKELGTDSNALNANGDILTMAKDNKGDIYISGYFTDSSGLYYLAKWDGTKWNELKSNNNLINVLYSDKKGNLYAGIGYSVAKWVDTAWVSFGNWSDWVGAMVADTNGDLYVGSNVATISSDGFFMAKLDSNSWTEVGTGFNALNANRSITSIYMDAIGSFFVGGFFTDANGKQYVAAYGTTTAIDYKNGEPDDPHCKNRIDTFYAYGRSGSNFKWSTVGGKFISGQNKDTAIIKWDSAGSWPLKLVESNGSYRDSAIDTIIINAPSANWTDIISNKKVTFMPNDPAASSYLWNFGDGDSSLLQNPVYTYKKDSTYKVRLIVTSASGCIDEYDSSIVISTTLGIVSSNKDAFNLKIYPNPSHNTFNIKLQGDNVQQSQINLYDVLGHGITFFTTTNNEFTINASDYLMKSGVYILTIRSGNAVLNAKLVVE